MHEAQLHERNCFITLTFANEHLPSNGSVSVRDWQLFMKRLRKSCPGQKIRSFACGEYGDEFFRPHYHALLFNKDFSDKQLFKTERGNPIYISSELSKIWPFGHATIGDLTYQSAAYVARYCMKKITGPAADDHYWRKHPLTGEMHRVQPEFLTMSRRPGLGADWLERFKTDVFPSDFVVTQGKKMRPPRFYDERLTEEEIEMVKRRRKLAGVQHRDNNTKERLRVREEVAQSKIKLLKRSLQEH